MDEGSVLSFFCKAVGFSLPSVEWSRPRHVHSSDTSVAYQEQGWLQFNPVEYNSDGKYVCRARNRFGLAETTIKVAVKGKRLNIFEF